MTAALSSYKCGTVIGPDCTGKRQTISLLAQACGQHLKEINCNEKLTTSIADRYMKGLVYSGSWVLFDKVDKLTPSIF